MMTRISIAGDIGSGKSTIAKAVAARIGVEPLSTGGIQRQLAAARGINTLELNRLAEADPSIDQQIDDYLRALPDGPLVVESRMAWHFVPGTYRIFLYILPAAAAGRILGASRSDESYRHMDEAIARLQERRESEIGRFQKYYGVDISNLRNYDLVIDSTHVGIDRIVDAIFGAEKSGRKPAALISPVDLTPTRHFDAAEAERLASVEKSMAERGFDQALPIEVLYVDHAFFIAKGHLRVAAAVRNGLDLIPCLIAAAEDEKFDRGPSARELVRAATAKSLTRPWEIAAGFGTKHKIGKE
jgi:cytidylate kinase